MTKQACFVTSFRAALSAARRCSGRTPGAGACTAGRPVVSAPTGFATRHANGATPSLWPPTRPRSAGSWPPSSARPEGGDRGASQHPILSSLKSLHRQRFSSTAGTRPGLARPVHSSSPRPAPRRLHPKRLRAPARPTGARPLDVPGTPTLWLHCGVALHPWARRVPSRLSGARDLAAGHSVVVLTPISPSDRASASLTLSYLAARRSKLACCQVRPPSEVTYLTCTRPRGSASRPDPARR